MSTQPHEEYLRRNLIHAGSIGMTAGLKTAMRRLSETKRPPKWLLAQLRGILDRAERCPPELAAWRNQADDAPVYMRPKTAKRTGQP